MEITHFDSKESVIDVKILDFLIIFAGRETELLKRASRRLISMSQDIVCAVCVSM